MQQETANQCGKIQPMPESPGITHLRQLVGRRKKIDAEIDGVVADLLRGGEYVEDIADALEESREKLRRLRKALRIPDARQIRKERGMPMRRTRD